MTQDVPPLTGQVLLRRVYRLGQQPELLIVEVVTLVIALVSIFGPPPPSLHAAVGTVGVRLWGVGMAGVASLFFGVITLEHHRPPRRIVLELVALVMHVVLWAGYLGYTTAVHASGYTSSLAIGGLVGILLVRVSEIVQDVQSPRWAVPDDLTIPSPGDG